MPLNQFLIASFTTKTCLFFHFFAVLLTAVLFLFSYFKFQRYGTDAGD